MDRPQTVDFEIDLVDGEHGERLAASQARAILDVLTWFAEHRGTPTSPSESSTDGQAHPWRDEATHSGVPHTPPAAKATTTFCGRCDESILQFCVMPLLRLICNNPPQRPDPA
ncbi:hypothetical protein E1258_21380 [Micromonospora sp. KC207]|nr:hypothetical protein E1258_21380 [Micromonospora sp. KC207]